jgi:hypothetical protein
MKKGTRQERRTNSVKMEGQWLRGPQVLEILVTDLK